MVGLGGIGRGQALAAMVKLREPQAPGADHMNQIPLQDPISGSGFGASAAPGWDNNNYTTKPSSGFGGGFGFGGDADSKVPSRPTSCRRCGQQGHFARDCPNNQQPQRCETGGFGGGFNSNAQQSSGGFNSANQQSDGGFGSGTGGGFGLGTGGGFGSGTGGGFGSGAGGGGNACRVCNEEGHFARDCHNKPAGGGACHVCNEKGHIARDCPIKPANSGACHYCKEVGHIARDCPKKPTGNACRLCNAEGHFARDCPNKEAQKCRNCDKEGHLARECPEPRREDHHPPPVDYVPEEIDEEKLFENLKISQGVHFSHIIEIPVQRTGKAAEDYPAIESFDAIDLPEVCRENMKKAGYQVPTPVQRHSMPLIAAGLDLMACAQTGSGKTAAFLLPIIHSLMTKGDTGKVGEKVAPSAIVIAPTRELARQICNDARMLAHGTNIPIFILYGGTKVEHQSMLLAVGGCSILVATPGRLMHFIEDQKVLVANCRFLVLDEADRMLDEGFGPVIRQLLELPEMPSKDRRQTLMFSATFEEGVQQLARDLLKPEFVFVAVGTVGGACLDITQELLQVSRSEKKDKLIELLRLDIEKYDKRGEEPYAKKTLVFVERKRTADVVATFLSQENLPATSIHGDRGQQQRELALSQFTSGKCPVLVATAVAGRGLDIKGVDHVINYDLPQADKVEDYVHRIGRTGRIGNPGRATSFFDAESDHELARALVKVLSDAHQIVPEWLQTEIGVGGVSGYGGRTDFESGASKDAWGADADPQPFTSPNADGDQQW